MGRGVAKLLASKGANVIVVARDQKKLDDAIAYISVLLLIQLSPKTIPNTTTGRRQISLNPTLPCHQRGPLFRLRKRTYPSRSNSMEQWPIPRHSMGLRRSLKTSTLPRHASGNTPHAHGSKLLVNMLLSAHRSQILASTFHLSNEGLVRKWKIWTVT